MCYTVQQLEERIRKQGLRNQNTPDEIQKALEIFRKQLTGAPLFLVSGFDHPWLHCIHREEELKVERMQWGLIPPWIKDAEKAIETSNMTLNARAESIFEKKSFRNAAKNNRCLLPVTGFFEYQHHKGKNFPYFIDWTDEGVRFLACIWEEWENPASEEMEKTFAIVTTNGNPLMAKIHNNPSANEPRMPAVLSGEDLLIWLDKNSSEDTLKSILRPTGDEDMKAHTVRPLRGKSAPGNSQRAIEKYNYPELNEPLTLF